MLGPALNWATTGLSRLPLMALLLVGGLAAFGVSMIYSAGRLDPEIEGHWLLHAQRFGLLLPLAIMAAALPPFMWRNAAWVVYPVGVLLLIAVELFGVRGGGAERWLVMGPIRIQPGEIMKVAVVLAVALYYASIERRNQDRTAQELWHIPALAMMVVPAALIFHQPNLSTGMMVIASGATIMFLSGVRWRVIGAAALGMVVLIPTAFFFILKEYQRSRILTFLDPARDPSGEGYHVQQAAIAIGSGGLWGRGWLQGTQSQNQFIPEQHTDFIYSVIAEEWGLMGSIVMLGAYFAFLAWGWGVAARANTSFHRFAAAGATVTIAFYIFVNLGMVIGLLPVVGVPLPLISHGGTAMATVMACFALLLHTYFYAVESK
jgi:rod shape determining protein RodA